jgi:arsenite transporter
MAARHPAGQKVSDAASTTMVSPMAATLLVVVASPVLRLDDSLTGVAAAIPFYAAFPIVTVRSGPEGGLALPDGPGD